ncbi:unnamed protein product [Amoebophrya sp. A120]|nr:unnamed protein product [Amoebophrya sp. A120]|eukprot:GSA120T00024622001.1
MDNVMGRRKGDHFERWDPKYFRELEETRYGFLAQCDYIVRFLALCVKDTFWFCWNASTRYFFHSVPFEADQLWEKEVEGRRKEESETEKQKLRTHDANKTEGKTDGDQTLASPPATAKSSKMNQVNRSRDDTTSEHQGHRDHVENASASATSSGPTKSSAQDEAGSTVGSTPAASHSSPSPNEDSVNVNKLTADVDSDTMQAELAQNSPARRRSASKSSKKKGSTTTLFILRALTVFARLVIFLVAFVYINVNDFATKQTKEEITRNASSISSRLKRFFLNVLYRAKVILCHVSSLWENEMSPKIEGLRRNYKKSWRVTDRKFWEVVVFRHSYLTSTKNDPAPEGQYQISRWTILDKHAQVHFRARRLSQWLWVNSGRVVRFWLLLCIAQVLFAGSKRVIFASLVDIVGGTGISSSHSTKNRAADHDISILKWALTSTDEPGRLIFDDFAEFLGTSSGGFLHTFISPPTAASTTDGTSFMLSAYTIFLENFNVPAAEGQLRSYLAIVYNLLTLVFAIGTHFTLTAVGAGVRVLSFALKAVLFYENIFLNAVWNHYWTSVVPLLFATRLIFDMSSHCNGLCSAPFQFIESDAEKKAKKKRSWWTSYGRKNYWSSW